MIYRDMGIKFLIPLILCLSIVGIGYTEEFMEGVTHEPKKLEYLPSLPSKDVIKELEYQLKKYPNKVEILIELGRIYHFLGISDKNKKAVEKAEKLLKKAIELDGKNAEAHAWYGSILIIKDRDAFSPFTKLKSIKAGMKEIDWAVKLAPDNIAVRMTRANSYMNLPKFLNKLEIAIADLNYLIDLNTKNPQFVPCEALPEIYLVLGSTYKRKGDLTRACESWQKVLDLTANSEIAEKAKRWLKESPIGDKESKQSP